MSSKNNTYYFPILPENLGQYFSRAILMPIEYLDNRTEDIQNKFPKHLLVSERKNTQLSGCSLEIEINGNDEEPKKISNEFYLFKKPLPVTRVKKIFFCNNEQKEITVNMAHTSSFIPSYLIEYDDGIEHSNYEELDSNMELNPNNYKNEYDKFNSYLGGFALMKISGDKNTNFSSLYFDTLSFFNQKIKQEYESAINKKIDPKYHGIFEPVDKTWKFFEPYIYSNENKSDEIEKELLKQGIKKRNNKYNIDDINSAKSKEYTLAILSNYGRAGNQSLDDYISAMISGRIAKKEAISLILGIYYGYYDMRNKYNFNSYEIVTKFELDSYLDYCTIESIYQFAFNNKRDNNEFIYLNWVKSLIENIECQGTFKILDKMVLIKNKEEIGTPEYWDKIYQGFPKNKISNSISKILCDKINSDFLTISEQNLIQLIEKSLDDEILNSLNSLFDNVSKDFVEYKKQNSDLLSEKQRKIDQLTLEIEKFNEQYLSENMTLLRKKSNNDKVSEVDNLNET